MAKKEDYLHIRTDKQTKEEVKSLAYNLGLTVSAYVIQLIKRDKVAPPKTKKLTKKC